MLPAALGLVVDDSPRLTASAADRVQSEVDDARRSKAVEVLRKALRNRRKKDSKKKSRTAAAETDAARAALEAGTIAEPAAYAPANRTAHAKYRVDAIRSAIRSHAALTRVCQTLCGMDHIDVVWIETGDGSAATIRHLMQECIDRLRSTMPALEAPETHNALETPETQSMIHKFLFQLVGVGVGTMRMLRLSTVEKLERTALALLQLLAEEGLGRRAVEVPTGAGADEALPGDDSV